VDKDRKGKSVMERNSPLVSVVIVHYKDFDYLRNCILSVAKSTYENIELIIVDNGLQKISPSDLPEIDIPINYISSPKNLGFGDGCNQGIHNAKGEFVFILNNDIEIDQNCIPELVKILVDDPSIAVAQPKMLDLNDKEHFHSSGAGGMIDILGYPFARGRILDKVEKDMGQYDNFSDIFWASGAAIFIRKDVLEKAGYFDTYYFMYMEEIDLIWRIHLLGSYRVVYVPTTKIYHFGCPNLGRENLWRMYYVHRNSLIMLLKNYSWITLLFIFPVRLILEAGTAAEYLFTLKWKRTIAILMAFGHIIGHLPLIIRKRRQVQLMRKADDRYVLDKMYKGSILLMYLFGYKKASQLL